MKIPTFTTRQSTKETNFSITKADPSLAQACYILNQNDLWYDYMFAKLKLQLVWILLTAFLNICPMGHLITVERAVISNYNPKVSEIH